MKVVKVFGAMSKTWVCEVKPKDGRPQLFLRNLLFVSSILFFSINLLIVTKCLFGSTIQSKVLEVTPENSRSRGKSTEEPALQREKFLQTDRFLSEAPSDCFSYRELQATLG